jgi:Rubrerythrin
MRKIIVLLTVAFAISFIAVAYAQGPGMMGGGMMGSGQKDQPDIGPGMMQGMGSYEQEVSIPDRLEKPKSKEWVNKLEHILALEKLSQAQYEADSKKYQVHMPYRMVIPQEVNHIEWINKLFAAYGLPSDVKVQPVKETTTLTQAYENARELENNLIPQYKWLINKAEDKATKDVLDTILLQTRIHYTMFDHALQMGWMRGQGMGPGMGRGGMMHHD